MAFGCLLNPGVGFAGRVGDEVRGLGAFGADGFAGLRSGREEADEVGHVAAADEDAAAVGWVAEEIGDPADGLGFDFRAHGAEDPGADVGVDGGGHEVREGANGGCRGGNVAGEERVAVVEGVVLQKLPRGVDGGFGGLAGFGERGVAEGGADLGGRFAGGEFGLREGAVEIGDLIDETMPGGAELLRVHIEQRPARHMRWKPLRMSRVE
jgi:hypothetical protein